MSPSGRDGRLACGSGRGGTKRSGDRAPLIGIGCRAGEVDHDAAHRHFNPRAQFQQAQPQCAGLGTAAGCPACMQAQLLEHDIGRRHQHAQLVGQETGATGAINIQALLQLLDAVLSTMLHTVLNLVGIVSVCRGAGVTIQFAAESAETSRGRLPAPCQCCCRCVSISKYSPPSALW